MRGSHVIDFNLDGSVEALHSDQFPLSFLGRQSITRATDIRFSEGRQAWDIWFPDPLASPPTNQFLPVYEATGFTTYEVARKVEVAWLNASRLAGVYPLSTRGREILLEIRVSNLGEEE